MTETTEFSEWAILELMGHRRVAGYVREVTLAGVVRTDDGTEKEDSWFIQREDLDLGNADPMSLRASADSTSGIWQLTPGPRPTCWAGSRR